MTEVVLAVSIITLVAVAALFVRGERRVREPERHVDAQAADDQHIGEEIQLVETGARDPNGPVRVALSTAGGMAEFAQITPFQHATSPAPAEELDWYAGGLAASLSHLPMVVSMWREATTLRVAFSPLATLKLATGQWKLVESAGRQIPTARSASGKFAANARVVGGALKPQAFLALGAVTAVSAFAAYQQQQQLEAMLVAIDTKLRAVLDRLQDSDFGVLDATQDLVSRVLTSLPEGEVPAQFSVELAVARRASDAVYFARRRWLQRTTAQLETIQASAAEKEGELDSAWVKGVEQALGSSPEDFETQVAQYLQSLVLRAQLATLTAMVLASTGFPTQATDVVNATNAELRETFFDLYRRTRGLAQSELPSGLRQTRLRKKQEPYLAVARRLVETMDQSVLPLLPEEARHVEILLRRSEDGTVTAMLAG